MAERISTLDLGYATGDLSVFPEAIDSTETLYDVKNNAETFLTQSLTFNGKMIVVDDATKFPDKGIVRVGQELIYYAEKTTNILKDLDRGFAGSVQRQWSKGTVVSHAVHAEHHNTIKDAIINIEDNTGLRENPSSTSLNGILKAQEVRFLAPKAKFRAFPLQGASALTVRFQSVSGGEVVRHLWDFGDGGTSTEQHPIHTYVSEGEYTVQLTVFTSLGSEGIAIKKSYIEVNDSFKIPFMYVLPEMGTTSTTFSFVDQTDGEIVSRYWLYDDGERDSFEDPNIHTTEHIYTVPGEYNPTLIVVYSDSSIRTVHLADSIIVT